MPNSLSTHQRCKRCANYWGQQGLVCGLYPKGPTSHPCPDWTAIRWFSKARALRHWSRIEVIAWILGLGLGLSLGVTAVLLLIQNQSQFFQIDTKINKLPAVNRVNS